MKVLYLPFNIASMQAITNQAMNNVPGVQSVCLIFGSHKYISTTGGSIIQIESPSKRKPLKYLKSIFLRYYYFLKLVFWADVVHYVWDSFLIGGIDLKIIKWLKKPGVVEWVGSDIRCPSRAFPLNSYYKRIFHNGYEYARLESDRESDEKQSKFKDAGLIPACAPEIQLYIKEGYFDHTYLLMQRIFTKNFSPLYPNINNKRPLIIHSPSAKITKGSNLIIPVIEELKKQYEFDFLLLHNLPHKEVLTLMQNADIFIDAIIMGGYGMATLEAMSFGKPVMCYIMPSLYTAGLPQECPVINTNPENLKEQLIKLITDPQLRYETGVKSREYVEKFHDAEKIALELLVVYKDVIGKRKEKTKTLLQIAS